MSVNFQIDRNSNWVRTEQVMPAPANSKGTPPQAEFHVRVKVRLAELQMSVTGLARALGLNRNTVSIAIHHDVHQPTRRKVAAYLRIKL